MRISDWSSDVCSSDLVESVEPQDRADPAEARHDLKNARDPCRGRRIGRDLHRLNRVSGRLEGGGERVDDPREHPRSVEHTSELQSLMRISYDVICLKTKKDVNKTTLHSRKKINNMHNT